MPSTRVITADLCKVCDAPNAIMHYGAISCRACGAFFRRVVAMGIKFECFCGIANANAYFIAIGRENVLQCKGCRQRKCLEVGMDKELVQSAKLQAIHRERRQMANRNVLLKTQKDPCINFIQPLPNIFLAELDEIKFAERIFQIAELAKQISMAPTAIPDAYFEENASLEAILNDDKNLLANSFQLEPDPFAVFTDKNFILNYARANGIFGEMSRLSTKVHMLGIGLAKISPAFQQLKMEDKIRLVKNGCQVFAFFFSNYYSAKLNFDVILLLANGYNLYEHFLVAAERYADQLIYNASTKIFNQPVKSFMQTNLVPEEFAWLLAMIFINSASPGLSDEAIRLLKEQEEKFGRALLRFQQQRWGMTAGAVRFTDALGLLWVAIKQAQNYRDLALYVDARHEPGRYRCVLPRALMPILE